MSRKTLRRIIRTKVVPESVIYTDSFRSWEGPVLDGFKHFRIKSPGELREGQAAAHQRHRELPGLREDQAQELLRGEPRTFPPLPERNGVPL